MVAARPRSTTAPLSVGETSRPRHHLARPSRSLPLPDGSIGFTSEQLETAWVTAQAELTDLSPNAPQALATGSDHYVQVRDPDLVIGAVRLIAARAEG